MCVRVFECGDWRAVTAAAAAVDTRYVQNDLAVLPSFLLPSSPLSLSIGADPGFLLEVRPDGGDERQIMHPILEREDAAFEAEKCSGIYQLERTDGVVGARRDSGRGNRRAAPRRLSTIERKEEEQEEAYVCPAVAGRARAVGRLNWSRRCLKGFWDPLGGKGGCLEGNRLSAFENRAGRAG